MTQNAALPIAAPVRRRAAPWAGWPTRTRMIVAVLAAVLATGAGEALLLLLQRAVDEAAAIVGGGAATPPGPGAP